ncbi:hypothetical protein C8A05DRAFT_12239 [Staphylotrichum tortipilum]|uniref:Uncharacterized protein n=1 Tax=Staphylotrichum tortipilum TaxID=2831512 RepID=A0AAN6RWX1_9PEZI|nr:hypothetical protein C8A05DRAFT_12239 [Staphylotrichum longicolle]
MKSTYLLGALACSLHAAAEQVPAAGVAARQWGEGGGGGWGVGGGESTCEWTDHCLGDPCETENDCDGQLICGSGACASVGATLTIGRTSTRPPTTRPATTRITIRPTTSSTPSCEWTGHCTGDPCETENDCDGQLICRSGKCGPVGSTIITTTRRTTTTRPVTTTTRRPTTSTTVRTTTTQRPGNPSCGDNPVGCIGASCRTDADCGFSLIICKDGVCGL